MLPFLAAAFVLGLLSGSQLSFFPLSVIVLSAGIAVGFSLLERAGHIDSRSALLLYSSFLLGVVYWSLATPTSEPRPTSPPLQETVHALINGRVIAPVQHSVGRQTILVQTDELGSEAKRVRLVWRDPGITLHHGDHIAFRGKLHRPRGSLNPGGFDYAAYVERQGVDRMTTVTGAQAVTLLDAETAVAWWSIWNRIDHWRTSIRAAALNTLSQPTRGLFLGMIIGERGYLDQELQDWFMVTGTVHLLSISGSHLGLVAIVAFWLARKLVLGLPSALLLTLTRTVTPSRIAILFAWPTVALYALLAGAELATMRSLVMISLAMIAMWLGHERHLGHAMAVAILAILFHDPRAIFDISFQLSFLSVLAMVRMIIITASSANADVAGSDSRLRDRLMSHALKALLMSGVVTVATLPLVALYFHQVPWMGIMTNLIAVPFTGLILVPLGLFVALWTIMTGAESLILGPVMEQLFGLMVLGLQWCARFPGGEWHVTAPSIPTIALFYVVLFLTSLRILPRRVRVASAGLTIMLIGWWLSPSVSDADGDRWRVTFLDVGQGDSAVVELPDGRTVLIDGGGRYERFDMGKNVVAPFLWSRGIRHLDHVIGTHQQLDHVGGLIWVLRHMSVGQYWSGGIERSEKFVEELQAVIRDRHIDQRTAVRGRDLLQSGGCRLSILNPLETSVARESPQFLTGTLLNNLSIVSRLRCGTYSILFAADIETAGLKRLSEEAQPVTVLKVPHHGARSSLDVDWIQQLRPRYAVISVGAANPYGHPVESVLQAYRDQHSTVFRTDHDGAIWVTGRLSTSELTMTRMRDLLVQPVDFPRCRWRCESLNWRRLFLQFS
ncbi:DNA internalization-related competence protein ComEC/Rec2 [Candidatus Nitrospira nitrificans]|uniref:Putative Competence protein ComEC/Rec2 related protein n=1 Tax=Candidatus Nitrospira nitrificans TaxID=1742973 RepID=A0A0S4LBY4_9BACT|nr:DNA internalization-related competence protein ComEC/Rec2 [Candidatus Nitrospira nitrificans]CUS34687.1 putative Competence protein ComEC/Rec2 related protein [Candidatus Nitrospira nitrificans]